MTNQCRNTKNNRLLIHEGVTKPLAAWAEEYNICKSTLWCRLQKGMSIAEALTTPIRKISPKGQKQKK